jgi:nucleotide-binding universal stress UspA family protein
MSASLPIEKILCPTDFSVFSSRSLRHAVSLARQFGAGLKVAHVIPGMSPHAAPGLHPTFITTDPRTRELAETELKSFVAPAVEARIPVETEVREGDAWRAILAMAQELPADLVVMGTHGRGGFERLVLGSVAEKLLHRLPCPILTVCHEEGKTWEAPGLVQRILCATDLSTSSANTVAAALSLAAKNQARATLLHVIEELPLMGETAFFAEGAAYRKQLERKAAQDLHEAAQKAEAQFGVEVDEWVGSGPAHKEILRMATEERADLIVLGPGHGALDHFLFGSHAQQVVRQATCPVLIVRPRAPRRSPHEALAVAMVEKHDCVGLEEGRRTHGSPGSE